LAAEREEAGGYFDQRIATGQIAQSRRNCEQASVLDSGEGSVSNGAAFRPVLHKNN